MVMVMDMAMDMVAVTVQRPSERLPRYGPGWPGSWASGTLNKYLGTSVHCMQGWGVCCQPFQCQFDRGCADSRSGRPPTPCFRHPRCSKVCLSVCLFCRCWTLTLTLHPDGGKAGKTGLGLRLGLRLGLP